MNSTGIGFDIFKWSGCIGYMPTGPRVALDAEHQAPRKSQNPDHPLSSMSPLGAEDKKPLITVCILPVTMRKKTLTLAMITRISKIKTPDPR